MLLPMRAAIAVDVRSLAAARAMVCSAVFLDALLAILLTARFFSDGGEQPLSAWVDNPWYPHGPLSFSRSETNARLLLLLMAASACAFGAGLWPRASGLLTWLLHAWMVLRNPYVRAEADVLLSLLLFALAVLPSGALGLSRLARVWASRATAPLARDWAPAGARAAALWAVAVGAAWHALRWRAASASAQAASWRRGDLFAALAAQHGHPMVGFLSSYLFAALPVLPLFLGAWYRQIEPAAMLLAAVPLFQMRAAILAALLLVDLLAALTLDGDAAFGVFVLACLRVALLPPSFWELLGARGGYFRAPVAFVCAVRNPLAELAAFAASSFLLGPGDVLRCVDAATLADADLGSPPPATHPPRRVVFALRSANGDYYNADAARALCSKSLILRPAAFVAKLVHVQWLADRVLLMSMFEKPAMRTEEVNIIVAEVLGLSLPEPLLSEPLSAPLCPAVAPTAASADSEAAVAARGDGGGVTRRSVPSAVAASSAEDAGGNAAAGGGRSLASPSRVAVARASRARPPACVRALFTLALEWTLTALSLWIIATVVMDISGSVTQPPGEGVDTRRALAPFSTVLSAMVPLPRVSELGSIPLPRIYTEPTLYWWPAIRVAIPARRFDMQLSPSLSYLRYNVSWSKEVAERPPEGSVFSNEWFSLWDRWLSGMARADPYLNASLERFWCRIWRHLNAGVDKLADVHIAMVYRDHDAMFLSEKVHFQCKKDA